jgi:hypothetical protein
MSRSRESGQATIEYVLSAGSIVLPLTFAMIFTAQLLWVWHSLVRFTQIGAHYAATHCWRGGENVRTFMRSNVPAMIDQAQFTGGEADIVVQYFTRNPETGALEEYTSCASGECSPDCVPDFVTVKVQNYEFRHFMTYLGLPPLRVADADTTFFRAAVPMESAGCHSDGASGAECLE